MEFYRPAIMTERYWALAVISQLFYWIQLTDGSSCLPQYHPYTEFSKAAQVYRQHELYHPDSKFYAEVFVDKRSSLLVGARNHLYVIDAETLALKKNITWSKPDVIQRCLEKGRIKSDCQNYIQLIEPFKDRLFICGTNALEPIFNITKLSDPSIVIVGNKNARSRCSPKYNLKPVSSVSGEFCITLINSNNASTINNYSDSAVPGCMPTRGNM